MRVSDRTVDHLIQRSVTAARVKAHGILVRLAVFADIRGRVPGSLRLVKLVIDLDLLRIQDLADIFKGVVLARRGIDDEYVFPSAVSFTSKIFKDISCKPQTPTEWHIRHVTVRWEREACLPFP